MNFDKHFDKYNDYSIIQKRVAENLNNLIIKNGIYDNKIQSIFEIGCGTGLFTRNYIKNNKNLEKLILNDKFDVKNFLKDIKYDTLILEDVEKLEIPKVDLILSSSVFQWIDDLENLIKKISESSNRLCFSTYVTGNLIEIKEHFGVTLNYLSKEDIEKYLKKYFGKVNSYSETIKIDFESSIDVLRHLKYTGVTGLQKPSALNVRSFDKKNITYEVAYFICEK